MIMEPDRISSISTVRTSINPFSGKDSSTTTSTFFSTTHNHMSGKYFWNVSGSKLEVFSFDEHHCHNRLISMFDFSEIFDYSNMVITNVIRLADRFEVASQYRHPNLLVVILQLIDSRNLISIVDIRLNNMKHYIEFPFNITAVEVILSGKKENIPNGMPLINELCCLNGILAVGCDGGLVFFLDLILDSVCPDPMIQKHVSMISPNTTHMDIEKKRHSTIFHNQVICIPLNAEAKHKGRFFYRTDDGTVMASFPAQQVYISALNYLPQMSLLCVGFNFGGFQLYNLKTFTMDCNCALDSDLLPVIEFAFQMPENDPKNFSYLWAVRGYKQRLSDVEESSIDSFCTAFIYLLCYKNRQMVENYGILYDTFKMCCCKFELPLVCEYGKNQINIDCISKLTDIFTIQQLVPFYKYPSVDDESDVMSPIDYNYLFIGWETIQRNVSSSGHRRSNTSDYYFCIFDLNQWYLSQMPKTYSADDDGHCPFISIYSLNSVAKKFSSHSVQAVYLANNSLSKFSSNMFYADIHSYPLSLSFSMTVAASGGGQICNVTYLGVQKRLLAQLGAVTNVKIFSDDCQDFITKCFKYGLLSIEHHSTSLVMSGDPIPQVTATNADSKSNMFTLIDLALENNLNYFLGKFIEQLCQEEDSIYTGTDLKLVVDWIWNKVQSIKNTIDLLTQPLFDMSGCNVSRQDISRLACYENQLRTLCSLLRRILNNSVAITNLQFDKLKARIEVVTLMLDYLKFVMIFEYHGLLPEIKPDDVENDDQIDDRTTYSYEKLSEFYRKRRQNFLNIDPNLFKKNPILLIDVIVDKFRDRLSTVWKKSSQEDEEDSSSLYPPENLHSLLQIFLLDSIPKIYKQAILFYFIHDISDFLQNQCIAKKFSISLSLDVPEGTRNFIKGIWFLDHQHYDLALQLFIHPLVNSSMPDLKHDMSLFSMLMSRIIEIFLFENHFEKALMFTNTCNHVRLDQEQNENLYIQILLLNGNLEGAIEFQRLRRSEATGGQLLYKIFFICEKIDTLRETCRLRFDLFEEKIYADYLLNSTHPNAKKILALYFVLNHKIIEAIKVVDRYEQEFVRNEENYQVLELVKGYVSAIPTPELELAQKFFDMANRHEPLETLVEIEKEQSPEETLGKKTPLSKFLGTTPRKPTYLSPGLSSSKIVRWKTKSQIRKLYDVLKTPDFKREHSILQPGSANAITKPILKGQQSQQHQESQKLKVSFFKEKIFPTVSDVSDCESTDGSQKSDITNNARDGLTTPVKRSRINGRKATASGLDSPSHRMILRSNKKV